MTSKQLLWFCAAALGGASALGPEHAWLPWHAFLLWKIAFSLAVAGWVIEDARKNGETLCYDYDTLVYFFWPIVVPVYLFRTRGLKAFLTLLGFATLCIGAALGWALVTFIRKMNS